MLSQEKRDLIVESLRDEGVHDALEIMDKDSSFNTDDKYSPKAGLYPGNKMPFVEKHIRYLTEHPKVDRKQYLANLRLMLKIR